MKSTFFSSAVAVIALGSSLLPSSTEAAVIDQCKLSLATLLSDPGLNSCLPLQELSQLVTEPVITPALVNSTATTFCSYPVCPAASLTLVQNTVTQNCVNASDPTTADLVYSVASLYPPAKEGVCQRVSPQNGTFCATVLTETLTTYLKKNPSPKGFTDPAVLKQYVDSMPSEILCTPCNKAMINPLVNYVAQNKNTLKPAALTWANVIQTEVQRKCGADFTNGAAPTPNDPSTSSNGKSGANGNHKAAGGILFALLLSTFLSIAASIF